jgi:hypothetical protein
VRTQACLCILILLTAAGGSQAEPADVPEAKPPADPGSALEIIEQQIQKSPPSLEPRGADPTITGFTIAMAAGSAGCAVWALFPGSEDWEPEERPHQRLVGGMGWGGLQGLIFNPYIGIGLSQLIPPPDRRAEYGSLLDASGPEREARAYQILRKRAERARQQRVAMALFTLGSTVLPAGVYYLGSAFVDRTPQEKEFGLGYVVGIALGSLPWAVFQLALRSDDEKTFAALEARRQGGAP